MNKKMLVIFNICELKYRNLFDYIISIDHLLEQEYDNYQIIISGCGVSLATKAALKKRFGGKLWYNYIDAPYQIPFTFNKTILEVIKVVGEFDGYIFVDSGIDTQNNRNCLTEINKRAQTEKYGIITLQTDDDMGYDWWFGMPRNSIIRNNDFIVPVGRCCNLHFQYYDKALQRCYGRLWPDIFIAYCSESVLSFFSIGVNRQWVIIKDLALHHAKGLDGSGVTFDHIGPKGAGNNLFEGMDVTEIVYSEESKAVGFGYNEAGIGLNQFYHMHDPAKFTADGLSKDPERLVKFIKDRLFLKKEKFDYDAMKFQLVL
jgi:hypothetical protein